MTNRRENSIFGLCRAVVAIVVAVLACLAFIGCGTEYSIGLSRDEITIYVGESRNVAPYLVFTPKFTDDKAVELTSDGDCVQTDGYNITGVAVGTATVTVSYRGSTASLRVNVKYREPNDIEIDASPLEQTVAYGVTPQKVSCVVRVPEYADPDMRFDWYVDGTPKSSGKLFEFVPDGYGQFSVSVKATDFEKSFNVRVYRPTTAEVIVSGSTHQTDGNFSPVKFVAREKPNTLNPRSVYEWYVNDDLKKSGAVFEFTPDKEGVFVVRFKQNGQFKRLFGSDSIPVVAEGERAPKGEIVFDGDSVYAVWNDGMYIVRATVICSDGSRVDLDSADAQNAYRFERGALNLTGVVDAYSADIKTYKIRLIADGQSEFEFVQYGMDIKQYLDRKVLSCDHFISSAEDAVSFVKALYACGITSAKCYLGRADGLQNAISTAASDLGLVGVYVLSGNVLSITFDDYCVVPEESEVAVDIVRMYSQTPHIEYDAAYRRGSGYVLAVDRARGGVEVTTSEQLLYVALSGEKPLPVKESAAYKIYTAARSVLLSVIAFDYDDVRKVHAIYDWLQWNTVTLSTCANNSSARFIEGVFTSSSTAAVTSEGAAKTFALLCRMEGIQCDIAVGAKDGEKHYYNTVILDGLKYNVDVCLGKIGAEEFGIVRNSYFVSHRALLVPDAAMRELGIAIDNSVDYAFSVYHDVFLQKRVFAGSYFDYYIERSEIDEDTLKSAVYYAFAAAHIGSVSVPTSGSIATFFVSSIGAEFKLANDITSSDMQKIYAAIEKSAIAYCSENFGNKPSENAVHFYVSGNIMNVVVTVQ